MITNWCALEGLGTEPVLITYSRFLRGKVHRARTDYRWIAVSQGQDPDALNLLTRLALGREDRPKPLCAWAPVTGGFAAVAAYPSQARDADGRQGGLEKQILYYRLDSNNPPPPAVALLLIEQARLFPDSVTAGFWGGDVWEQTRHRHAFTAADCPPLLVDPEAVRKRFENGRQELLAHFTLADLAAVYQQLLDSVNPAILYTSAQSLSPEALLALLLPLPPALANRLAVVTDLPTARFEPELFANWSIATLPGASTPRVAGAEATNLAAALASSHQTASPEPPLSAGAIALQHFLSMPARSLPLSAVSEQWRCSEPEGLLLADQISEYERAVAVRTQYPSDLTREEARRRHLQVKVEVARSLLAALAPYPSVRSMLARTTPTKVSLDYYTGNRPAVCAPPASNPES